MTEAVYLQINIQIGPFNSFIATHLNIQNILYRSISHPWNTII